MRSTSFVRTLLALAIAILLGGTLLAAPAQSSPRAAAGPVIAEREQARLAGCNVPRCWTAISFNTVTGYSGWTVSPNNQGLSSKAAAMRSAYTKCRARPENVLHKRACVRPGVRNVYNRNGCVAVFFRRRGDRIVEWAKGTAYNREPAKREAKRIVSDGRGEVVLSRYSCTKRHL